jgi:quercetin dioxygenase-like cupin family protein
VRLTHLACDQHDETFLVTQGTLRFHALNGATVDAKLGDYVTVPPRAPHTFSNPYDAEAKFFNTYTPAFYIDYFRLLAKMGEAGQPMNPDANRKAMAVSVFIIAY